MSKPVRPGVIIACLLLGSSAMVLVPTALIGGWPAAEPCSSRLELMPTPREYPSWPHENEDILHPSGDPHALFGFTFTFEKPMGSQYPGYGYTRLLDSPLCTRSQVTLDAWFAGGEVWWIRSPDELTLYREPSGNRFVITGKGMNADGTTRGPEVVTAFRRVAMP